MIELRKIRQKLNLNDFIFDSGISELNNFFFVDSKEFIREDYCQVYFLKEKENNQVIGFIAVSNGLIEFKKGMSVKKRLKYIPGMLIGQLAIDKKFQHQGYGTDLLKKAIKLSLNISKRVGCRMVIVDALTDLNALKFYKKYSFKYLKKDSGEKIEKLLLRKQPSGRNTIRMYFDLHYLKPNPHL